MQLGVDVGEVVAYGLVRETEAAGDLCGGRTGGERLEDGPLAWCQVWERVRRDALGEDVLELPGRRCADHRSSGVDAVDRLDDLVLRGALEEVASRAGAQRLSDGSVVPSMVNTMIPICGACVRSARVASIPFVCGIEMSMRTMSGWVLRAASIPLAPSAAAPHGSMSGIVASKRVCRT